MCSCEFEPVHLAVTLFEGDFGACYRLSSFDNLR